MEVPEFRWPTTPLTLASTSFCAAAIALLRVRAIVFGEQLELDRLPADGDALGVQVIDGEPSAHFVVLAQVRDLAAGRADVTNLDDRRARGLPSGRP